MEKTRNSVIDLFKDLFKNFGLVISKLVNGGEIDDVELTGELAQDPMEALTKHVKSVEKTVQVVKTRARTKIREKAPTREASAVKHTTTINTVNDDEREI